ncbi:zinc finger protein OZF-like protein [Dinothrombium tinctorium]|uniref:Zinc finger protein OZF-like protein n=1 Tax=Dinothrombium tinctorium TaxID=1965070 RepID=A0A3S3P652_9ACAR|nr:zinc finger protein OZF-like protein [Dinothrombium tinctorium]RWS12990.1 zinc finger protein OZF-like protein [Dinothrombium tinctorium]RWS13660.1 zinc finger protein OZF-like protein [Dinothrombium tinctorium]RWS14245.1 zinc finger protein OZF-like protein [Dinothrombium tinctorium]
MEIITASNDETHFQASNAAHGLTANIGENEVKIETEKCNESRDEVKDEEIDSSNENMETVTALNDQTHSNAAHGLTANSGANEVKSKAKEFNGSKDEERDEEMNSSNDEANNEDENGSKCAEEGDQKQKGKGRGRRMTQITFLPSDCKLCGEKFSSDKALGYHIRDVHVVGKNNADSVKESDSKKETRHRYVRHGKGNWKVANPKRPYCCQTCGKRFMYESSLVHHQMVKHNQMVPIEGKEENESSNQVLPKLYSHTFQCDQCGKILMSKQSLITHFVSFHGTDHEKPFQCDICGQRYVSISSLVSHRRREHTGDKPYVCEHCGKAFTMSNRLKCHLRVHSDEKYYKCQDCSKEFKSCSAFRAHKDTHAGVMRHTCKFCGRKFLFQGNMIKHIRRRHPNGEKIESAPNHEDSNEDTSSLPPITPITASTPASDLISLPQNHFAANKEANSSITIPSQPHLPEMSQHHHQQQQQQQHQGITTVGHSVQPEIQFQVLPMSLPNQELFNGIAYHQQQPPPQPPNQHHQHIHQSATVQIQRTVAQEMRPNARNDMRTDLLAAGGCHYCDQHFPDIRLHLTDFHRIPIQKLDSTLPALVYY